MAAQGTHPVQQLSALLLVHQRNELKSDFERQVFEAQQLVNMADMYAAIFAAGALGYGLNLMFLVVERRFVHWAGR